MYQWYSSAIISFLKKQILILFILPPSPPKDRHEPTDRHKLRVLFFSWSVSLCHPYPIF